MLQKREQAPKSGSNEEKNYGGLTYLASSILIKELTKGYADHSSRAV
jgi:hypothetical protein